MVRVRNPVVADRRADRGNATAPLHISYEKVSVAVAYTLRTVNFYTSRSASNVTCFTRIFSLNSWQQNTKHFFKTATLRWSNSLLLWLSLSRHKLVCLVCSLFCDACEWAYLVQIAI